VCQGTLLKETTSKQCREEDINTSSHVKNGGYLTGNNINWYLLYVTGSGIGFNIPFLNIRVYLSAKIIIENSIVLPTEIHF